LGPDRVTFGAVTGPESVGKHEGLNRVWITVFRDGGWTSVGSAAEAAKQIAK